MRPDEICKLVVALPPDEPYFRLAFRNEPGEWPRSLSERLQIALSDPARAGNFARSYAGAELPLPEFDWDDAIPRAYDYFLHPDHSDENLRLALELQRPEHWFERDVIRGLIWCRDTNDAAIAEIFQFEPEVVHLIQALFWDCRDRLDDPLYLTQLLNGGRSERRGGPGEFGRNLLRVACKTGKRHAVLLAAGLSRPAELGEDDVLAGQIEEILRTLAATGQEQALSLVDKYLEEPAATEWMDDLTKLSLNSQAAAELRGILLQGARERLQAQREELEREFASAANRGDKGSSGSTPCPPNTPSP